MATKTIEFVYKTGKTALTARLFAYSAPDTLIDTMGPAEERASAKTLYTVNTDEVVSSESHKLVILDDGVPKASYDVDLEELTSLYRCYDRGQGESSNLGPGADECTIIVLVDSLPVADADVWITADSAGDNVIAGTRQTNSNGEVLFMLDGGNTYYMWMQKDGVEPIEGEGFVAQADV